MVSTRSRCVRSMPPAIVTRHRRRGRLWSMARRRRRRWRRVVRRLCSPTSRGRPSSAASTRASSRPARRRHRWRCPDGEHTFSVRAVDARRQPRRDAGDADVHGRHDGAGDRVRGVASRAHQRRDAELQLRLVAARRDVRVLDGRRGVRGLHVAVHDRRAPDGRHTFAVRAIGANPDPTPAVSHVPRRRDRAGDGDHLGAGSAVHGGRSRSALARTRTRRSSARSTAALSVRARPYRAEDLGLGEHVFRARATDRAGNVDATPAERPLRGCQRRAAATLALDRDTGPAPHTPTITVAARRTVTATAYYELDFGDGQQT